MVTSLFIAFGKKTGPSVNDEGRDLRESAGAVPDNVGKKRSGDVLAAELQTLPFLADAIGGLSPEQRAQLAATLGTADPKRPRL